VTSLPEPVPGLVIRYSYLWFEDHARGREEGTKDRPCVVVLAVRREGGRTLVTVAPITHRPPSGGAKAVEVPAETKVRLSLDHSRSWIVTNELNEFQWPGPDIRPIAARGFAYGLIPRRLYESVRTAIVSHLKEHGLKVTPRT
jgi:hypothetical protein